MVMPDQGINRLRWLHLRANRFGSLEADLSFDPGKLTILSGRNEAGKSTMQAAIVAALYGVDTRNSKSDFRPNRGDYTPWGEGEYALHFELEWNSRVLTVKRNFAPRKPVISVFEGPAKDLTRDYLRAKGQDGFGEIITGGMSPGGFLRSFVIQQEQAVISRPGDLVELLQKVVTASPGDSTTRAALDLLHDQRRNIQFSPYFKGSIKLETALSRIEKLLYEAQQESDDLEDQISEAAQIIKEIEEKEQLLHDKSVQLKELEVQRWLNEKHRLKSRLNNAANASQQLKSLEERAKELQHLEDFPIDDVKRFEDTYSRFSQAQEQGNQIQEQIRLRSSELEIHEEDLSEFGELAEQEQEDLSELLSDLREWSAQDRQREEVQAQLDDERESLARSGIFVNRLEKNRELMTSWGDDIPEKYRAARKELEELERERTETDKRYLVYRKPTNKHKLRPFLFIVVSISIIAAFASAQQWKLAENTGIALILSLSGFVMVLLAAIYEAIQHYVNIRRFGAKDSLLKTKMYSAVEKYDAWSRSLGVESLDDLGRVLDDSQRWYGKGERFFELRSVHQAFIARRDEVTDRIRAYLELSGVISSDEDPVRGDIEGLAIRVKQLIHRMDETKSRRNRLEGIRESARKATEEIAELHNELKAILENAGIQLGERTKDAADTFLELAAQAKEYKYIEKQIDELKHDYEDETVTERLRQRLEELNILLGEENRDNSSDVSDEELARLEEVIRHSRHSLDREITDQKLRYFSVQEELPKKQAAIQDRLEELKDQRNKLIHVDRSTKLAIEILEEVEKDVFGSAAFKLNQEMDNLLERLNPRWKKTRFDDDLNLSAEDSESGIELKSDELLRVLSTGARDALYLGARLVLGDFLAGGIVDAPYLLDEPFAHFDDERFISGMNLLVDQVKKGNQVVLLTCHESRHREWIDSLDTEKQEFVDYIRIGV